MAATSVTYTYPISRELMEIAPAKIARLSENRLGLKIMPVRGVEAAMIEWTQRDNYYGLQKIRGYGGSPTRVSPIGSRRYRYEPAVYGEFVEHDEQELATRAGSAVGDVVIDITGMITEDQDQLLGRELDRIEQIIWALLGTGTFAIAQARGDGTTTVVFTDTFEIQTITATVPFSDYDNSFPLRTMRQMATLGRGKGLIFGRKAMCYVNQTELTNILNNSNPKDLGGKLLAVGEIRSLDDINKVLLAQDLPMLEAYDEGYDDDDNAFQLFIPDGKMIVIGAHNSGGKIGEYIKTRNPYAGNTAKSYSLTKNYMTGENAPVEIGKGLEVHQGHNGGPCLYYPGAVVVFNI